MHVEQTVELRLIDGFDRVEHPVAGIVHQPGQGVLLPDRVQRLLHGRSEPGKAACVGHIQR